MAIYRVQVLEEVVQSSWHEIEADSPEQAGELVMDGNGQPISDPKWESGSFLRAIKVEEVSAPLFGKTYSCHNPRCDDCGKRKPANSDDFYYDGELDLLFCAPCGGSDVY